MFLANKSLRSLSSGLCGRYEEEDAGELRKGRKCQLELGKLESQLGWKSQSYLFIGLTSAQPTRSPSSWSSSSCCWRLLISPWTDSKPKTSRSGNLVRSFVVWMLNVPRLFSNFRRASFGGNGGISAIPEWTFFSFFWKKGTKTKGILLPFFACDQ